MDRAMTVDELIEKLRGYSELGLGDAKVLAVPAGTAVENVFGPITYTNQEGHAVLLYAKASAD